MKETQFKKGERTGVAARNWKPVGTILRDTDGDLRIKLREHKDGERTGFGNQGIWAYLKKVIWEKAHGPVPKGMLISVKNGDKTDMRLDNLECITRAEHIAHIRETNGFIAATLSHRSHRRGAPRQIDRDVYREMLKLPEILEVKRQQLRLKRKLEEQK